MSDLFTVNARPAGGHKIHIVRRSDRTALCGFKPSSPRTWRMVERHGWRGDYETPTCKQCLEARSKQ